MALSGVDPRMGAFYHRSFPSGRVEQMQLPAYIIEKIGYVPPPEIAELILEMKMDATGS